MLITLYTYQTKEAVEVLRKNGVLKLHEEDRGLTYVGTAYDQIDNHFKMPYDFIRYEMMNRLPAPKDDKCYYPIWAWYKLSGRYRPSKKWDKVHEGKIRLTIKIDSSRLLLSDFDMFCYLIVGGLYFNLSKEDEIKYKDKIFEPDEFYYPNWEYIFDIHRKVDNDYGCSYRNETIQATFWELYLEDVVEMKEV